MTLAPAGAQMQDPDAVRTILVLPAGDESGSSLRYVGRVVSEELVLALTASHNTGAWEFDRNAPQVRRALADGRLLPVEVEAGAADAASAVSLAAALGADAALMTTVRNLAVLEEPAQATVRISGRVYPVEGNFDFGAREPVAEPRSETAFDCVGHSRELVRYSGPVRALVVEAARDAAQEAAIAIGVAEPPEPVVPPPAQRREMSWLTYVLGVGLLAILVGGSSTSRDPAGALAPQPIALSVEDGGIRVIWAAPPPGGKTLLKYQIQRSYDGDPWAFIDDGLVVAGWTEFFDDNIPSGAYRYRISAVYTDQSVSPWAIFSQVIFP